jgi:uncharacterized membrane protein
VRGVFPANHALAEREDSMAETVTEFLSNYVSPELVVFIISLLPILELRGGLIAASLLGIPWQSASILCILGTVLPVPFILLFIQKILQWLTTVKLFEKLATHFIQKAQTKGKEMMQKYPERIQIGLFLFVAIPLPGTGAWTGSLIASFLGLPLKKSIPPIIAGAVGAAVIMLVIAYVFPAMLVGG